MKVTRTALPRYSRRLTGSPSELFSSSGAAVFGGDASAPANLPWPLAEAVSVVESEPLLPQPAAISAATISAQAQRRAGRTRLVRLVFSKFIRGRTSQALGRIRGGVLR